MMRFNLFDRWGKQIGALDNVLSVLHKDVLNGEDSLTLTLPKTNLIKGQRIVWCDRWGVWHEHIINEITDIHNQGKLYASVYCENSIAELYTDYIVDLRPIDATSSEALRKALSNSRWELGRVDVMGTNTTNFYHISAREAVADVVKVWGGEISTTIEVTGCEVTARKINLTSRRGDDTGKRFEWTKDLTSIQREVSADDVVTALYGYGKGLPTTDDDGNATGGYSRKLTFGGINGGKDYVTNESAKDKWGLPDGAGGIKHTFGKVEFNDCEDERELLNLTRAALEEKSKPQIAYKASIINLADAGYEFEDVRTGDTVAIIDRDLDERISGRVLSVTRHLFDEQATVIELGNLIRSITSPVAANTADLNWIKSHASGWTAASQLGNDYMDAVISRLNAQMNAEGGYTYYEPGEGLTTYDKPVDQNPTMAIQIKGGGFRIANSKKSNGEWNWRAFGDGSGFTADCITAGTIKGGANYWNLSTGDLLFKQGKISDAAGKSEWNLSTGAFSAQDINAWGTFTSKNGNYYVELKDGELHSVYNGVVKSKFYMGQPDQNGKVLTSLSGVDGLNISSTNGGITLASSNGITVVRGSTIRTAYSGTITTNSGTYTVMNGLIVQG